MKRYTVTWKPNAKARLAHLWNSNPRIRQEIADAADKIDRLLAINPLSLGEAVSERSRQYIEPPLLVLFAVSPDDRMVRVIFVKIWFEASIP